MVPPAIDTSVRRSMYAQHKSATAAVSGALSPSAGRQRSHSTASTASSISIVTPVPSSGNPSSSSLNLSFVSDQTPSTSTFVNTSDDDDQASVRSIGHGLSRRTDDDAYDGRRRDFFSGSDERDEDEDADSDEGPELYVRAMHDFVPQQQNATCLAFSAGETIRVLNRDASGWWDGQIEGRRGWFPSNYVTPIEHADHQRGGALASLHAANVIANSGKHGRSMSDTSFNSSVSRASTAAPDHPPTTRKASASVSVVQKTSIANGMLSMASNNTPPLMIPLLNGLQLLQNTTLARRVSHYQPAVGCIIQCIRALLQHTDCLARGAPLLRRFPIIAQERKRVLAELALLVTQSKKASAPDLSMDEERDPEEELMLRLAGQVFARVRRFLAVIVQCGVDLPDHSFSASVGDSSTSETACEPIEVPLGRDSDSVRKQYGFNNDEEGYYPLGSTKRPGGPSTPSPTHLKQSSIAKSIDSNATTMSRSGARAHQKTSSIVHTHPRYRGGHMSLGSASSFSSFSSPDSPNTPATPSFPEGPCTAQQVQQALRLTHDALLSTIAAFIGHVHQHSRAAHASSTGHLFALVRQIVDVVCRLLTVVDAVMGVEAIPLQKRASLEMAKENLYQMACGLADAVREMATGGVAGLPAQDEEEERRKLLKVATDALKAGSDCVTAVKLCLLRPPHVPPYTIVIPPLNEGSPPTESMATMESAENPERVSFEERNGYGEQPVAEETLEELHEQVQLGYATTTDDFDDEDTTAVQDSMSTSQTLIGGSPPGGRTPKPNFAARHPPSLSLASRDKDLFCAVLKGDSDKNSFDDISEREETEDESIDSPATTSATTLPGSHESDQNHANVASLEDKLINGDLPSIPQAADEDELPLTWALSHDHAPQDVAYNNDGQLVGATLEALVEKLTPHDSMLDASLSAVFFMTFRLFTTPLEFAEVLIRRFELVLPSGLSDEDRTVWTQQKLMPVRLRVQNLLKSWLETHWRSGPDDEALPVLQDFVQGPLAENFKLQAQRLDDLLTARSTSTAGENVLSPVSERQRLRDAGMPISPPSSGGSIPVPVPLTLSTTPSETPRPIMTKALLGALRARNFPSIAVTDFDPLELARQLTLIESDLYCKISAEEVLEMGRRDAPPAVNVKAVTTLSTAVTGWVSESILGEQDVKKRMLLVKFFIKLADRCTTLNNFSTPRSILAALDSSTISRLSQTWQGLAQKNRLQLEALRRLADHARNYHEYRARLRNTAPPAVPFLGLYLTDLTFCREGNPSHRPSPLAPAKKLLNWNKYHKLARIVQDMQRFQVPSALNLKDVPEAQEYIHFCLEKAKDHGDLDDLYRRSQLLEPKRAAETPTSGELKPSLFSWGSRSQAHTSSSTSATTATVV